MRIDIYHLYQHVDYANAVYPLMVDVLKVWAQSSGWETRVSVCRENGVDVDTDVVAFSVFTQTAPAAYRLSATLRQRGKIVILGGPHFRGSDNSEGRDHCDVLVYSICQQQWADLLRAVERRQIRAASGAQARALGADRRADRAQLMIGASRPDLTRSGIPACAETWHRRAPRIAQAIEQVKHR